MKNTLKLGAIATLFATSAFSAGIDRSGQGIGILFEEGRVVQFGLNYVAPEVTGSAISLADGQYYDTGNAAKSYATMALGYKADIGNFSYALIYDEPFGALADYETGSSLTSGLNAELNSSALTLLVQYHFNEKFSIYGGARAQSLSAKLENPAVANYTISSDDSVEFGYTVGAAYEIPKMALRLDVTYNSAIEHNDIDINEASLFTGGLDLASQTNVTTPQSLNINFQTGINEKTLVFAGARWVDWSEFDISPDHYAALTGGGSIVDYTEDSITYTIGAARKINDSWSIAGSLGYEAATDGVSTFLSPTNGKTSVSLAAIYTVGNSKIQFGGTYVALGDAETSNNYGIFEDNSALGFGIKLTQSF